MLGLPTPSITAVGRRRRRQQPRPRGRRRGRARHPGGRRVAPGASQVVYFTANTGQGFSDAIAEAIHATPTPVVVSVSWGGPEDSWSPQSKMAIDQAITDGAILGVTVTVSAGDNGSSDDPNSTSAVALTSPPPALTRWPAAAPSWWATRARPRSRPRSSGTSSRPRRARAAAASAPSIGCRPGRRTRECPRRRPGGTGIGSAAAPGRGLPDVAGNADPVTGYPVIVDGQSEQIGGTSAVAPLWAGHRPPRPGHRQALRPAAAAALRRHRPGVAVPGFHDIVEGDNGAYQAGPGWDPCTGLGSPHGTALLSRLSGS